MAPIYLAAQRRDILGSEFYRYAPVGALDDDTYSRHFLDGWSMAEAS